MLNVYKKINSELHLVRTEDMLAVMEGCCSSSVLKGKIDRAAGLGCLKEVSGGEERNFQ